jgi:hypothetical protein
MLAGKPDAGRSEPEMDFHRKPRRGERSESNPHVWFDEEEWQDWRMPPVIFYYTLQTCSHVFSAAAMIGLVHSGALERSVGSTIFSPTRWRSNSEGAMVKCRCLKALSCLSVSITNIEPFTPRPRLWPACRLGPSIGPRGVRWLNHRPSHLPLVREGAPSLEGLVYKALCYRRRTTA